MDTKNPVVGSCELVKKLPVCLKKVQFLPKMSTRSQKDLTS
jgi:hypothetical protein